LGIHISGLSRQLRSCRAICNNTDSRYDQDSQINTTEHEETLTGQPHDTSVQKATSDNDMWMQLTVKVGKLTTKNKVNRAVGSNQPYPENTTLLNSLIHPQQDLNCLCVPDSYIDQIPEITG